MVVLGENSFAVLLVPYLSVTPIVALYVVLQPRLEKLTTLQVGGMAMVVVAVPMAEVVVVEVTEVVAALEMVETLEELTTLL